MHTVSLLIYPLLRKRSLCGTMKTTIFFFIGLALVASCIGLDCPDCNKRICKDPEPCRLGKTLDMCGCCSVCFKGIGEECGGPWNAFGECAHHLSCIRIPKPNEVDPVHEFNTKGKCLALP